MPGSTARRDTAPAWLPVSSAQHAVDGVAVKVGRAMTVARRVTFGQRAHDVEELIARQLRIGIRTPHEVEESVFGPLAGGNFGDDLLREDIERFLRNQN